MGPAAARPGLVDIPASLIDDFGDVSKLRDEFAPTERLYQKLRAELAELVAGANPDEDFVELGKRWTLDISARKIERKVDVKAARKRLGAKVFLEVCSVTLKALERFLLKLEIDALAISTQTGSRSYVTTPRG